MDQAKSAVLSQVNVSLGYGECTRRRRNVQWHRNAGYGGRMIFAR